MKLCIFEDSKWDNLYPLTLFRPVWELRLGYFLLWQKFYEKYNRPKTCFFTRDYLVPTVKKRLPPNTVLNDPTQLKGRGVLLVNGRWLGINLTIPLTGDEEVWVKDGEFVYARLNAATIDKLYDDKPEKIAAKAKNAVKNVEVKAILLEYPWDIFCYTMDSIRSDFDLCKSKGEIGIRGKFHDMSVVYGPEDVYIAEGAEIQPHVALDTSGGPIIIGSGTVVQPNSRIEGPASIGERSLICGGKIREGCSFGDVCMVGGEVENSIFHGWMNKFYDGFIGHAYVCEWTNIGALVANSDIKNNYSDVKMYFKGQMRNTKMMKLGCIIGDHSKLGIGVLLNTGSVIGACTNIFASEGAMPPKYVPSFSWGSGNNFVKHKLEKSLETAKAVFGRRNATFTREDADLIKKVYELTKEERVQAEIK